jgi:hypothetical protein
MGKRRAQKVTDVQPSPAVPAQALVAQSSDSGGSDGGDWWHEDPRREQALEMFLDGIAKTQIAKKLDVHRNTIRLWCTNSLFVAEANYRLNEHKAGKRIRRLRATNIINDKLERVAVGMVSLLEHDLKIDDTTGRPKGEINEKTTKNIRVMRELLHEFRSMRGEERQDFGDDIKKIAINKHQTITGDVQVVHQGVNNTPFVDYLRRSLDSKVIDVESIEVPPEAKEGTLLLKAAEAMLVDTALLDEIDAEDKAADAAMNDSE